MQSDDLIEENKRLQAEVERLKSSAESWEPIHDDDLTAAETFLNTRLKDAMFFPTDARTLANIAMHCIREVRAARYELTKARGLLESVVAGTGTSPGANKRYGKIREFLSNQSAPADKGQGVPVAIEAGLLRAFSGHAKQFTYRNHPATPSMFPVGFPWFKAGYELGIAEQPAPVAVVMPEKYDDVLLPFLSLMRAELHANAHKGDRPGWLQMDRKTAVLEVFYHMGKLHQAVHRDEAQAIKEYAADVANMCMMLTDVCGYLNSEPKP